MLPLVPDYIQHHNGNIGKFSKCLLDELSIFSDIQPITAVIYSTSVDQLNSSTLIVTVH